MISKKTGVSIFFPCYNDKKTIAGLIQDALLTIKKFTTKYEIVVVDDGSEDGSRDLLLKLSKQYKKLKLIFHSKNTGYGGALKSGFKTAKYELVFYTDGDGQYDVKELPILLGLMSANIDFVNGIKLIRHDPEYRVIIGNFYKFLVRWAFYLPIVDVDCDFRLIRKSLLNKFRLKSSSGAICVELVKKADRCGGRFAEVSINHYQRKWGHSQFFRLDRILSTYLELTILWIKLMLIDKLFKR